MNQRPSGPGTGMKLGVSHQRPEQLMDGYLSYLRQMGVKSLEVRLPAAECSPDHLVEIRQLIEDAGFSLFEIMMADGYNLQEAATGRPGRDAEIERFKAFVRDLGRAGIGTTTYAWHTGGAYETGKTVTRSAHARLFELDEAQSLPDTYERPYSDDEMWDAYEHFIREVLPIAEDAGVRLQLHPNDPPVTHMGVARIFRSTAAYTRAMEISGHSPYSGILFCVGCWAEMVGPDGARESIADAIREFGSQGHIFQVHFRNVSSALPSFHETFPDDGYLDMYRIMKALGEVGFDGMVVPDHVPETDGAEGGPRAGEAFIFGYIRALMQVVDLELRGER